MRVLSRFLHLITAIQSQFWYTGTPQNSRGTPWLCTMKPQYLCGFQADLYAVVHRYTEKTGGPDFLLHVEKRGLLETDY